MKFVDPTNDLAFKKIFGDSKKKHILISFLNAMLDFKDEQIIIDVEIANPYQVPKIEELKETILDIQATDKSGRNFIVEMQKNDKGDFSKRSLYYTSKAYVSQLGDGEPYKTLKKVYFIGIVNFKIFKTDNYISRHLILDAKTYQQELADFEFAFIELPKFQKTLQESQTIADKWLFFLKNTKNLDIMPSEFENLTEFKEAFIIANQFGWSAKEIQVYDYMKLKEMDQQNELETAEHKGFKKGLDTGIEQGKLEVAKNLLDVLDDEIIAQKTGLSVDNIKMLRNNIEEQNNAKY